MQVMYVTYNTDASCTDSGSLGMKLAINWIPKLPPFAGFDHSLLRIIAFARVIIAHNCVVWDVSVACVSGGLYVYLRHGRPTYLSTHEFDSLSLYHVSNVIKLPVSRHRLPVNLLFASCDAAAICILTSYCCFDVVQRAAVHNATVNDFW